MAPAVLRRAAAGRAAVGAQHGTAQHGSSAARSTPLAPTRPSKRITAHRPPSPHASSGPCHRLARHPPVSRQRLRAHHAPRASQRGDDVWVAQLLGQQRLHGRGHRVGARGQLLVNDLRTARETRALRWGYPEWPSRVGVWRAAGGRVSTVRRYVREGARELPGCDVWEPGPALRSSRYGGWQEAHLHGHGGAVPRAEVHGTWRGAREGSRETASSTFMRAPTWRLAVLHQASPHRTRPCPAGGPW